MKVGSIGSTVGGILALGVTVAVVAVVWTYASAWAARRQS